MTQGQQVDRLDDRTIGLILQHLPQELGEGDSSPATAVQDEDEARLAVATLLEAATDTEEHVDPARIVPEDADIALLGRRLLKLMLADQDVGETARELLEDPPEDDQMDLGTALTAAAVLGSLITWMQTKVDLDVERDGATTKVRFRLRKEATNEPLLKELLVAVKGLLLS